MLRLLGGVNKAGTVVTSHEKSHVVRTARASHKGKSAQLSTRRVDAAPAGWRQSRGPNMRKPASPRRGPVKDFRIVPKEKDDRADAAPGRRHQ